jgi:uncharacterized protein DUF2752
MTMLRGITSRPGFIAWMLGVILVCEILATRFAFTADNDLVYVLGHPINIVCAAKQHFGIPCPTCGFTRGFVLSVHGNIGGGWRLSPSGPLAAIAIAGAALAFFAFAILQGCGMYARVAVFRRWVGAATLAYGVAGTIVWLGTWISVVRALT